jgi:hypothetical protein
MRRSLSLAAMAFALRIPAALISRKRAVAEMTDDQFRLLLTHLRIIIVILGFALGILLAFAWEYL